MLMRISVSGGSYNDWQEAVYDHTAYRSPETPLYLGGLIKELAFQEVISTSATEDEPLGELAGRGRLTGKHKGGKVIAKVHEPSYLMGIVSLTPRIDYSQGNKWDTALETYEDLHKPALDRIGFQDLITDQMAWWDTTGIQVGANTSLLYKSAGKTPAWVNYMTNVDVVRGNFADQTSQMWMVLNRRYEPLAITGQGQETGEAQVGTPSIAIMDLTTYIDPVKFNHIFADTRRDAQNFWIQIGVKNIARRKMSAKVMPNL